MRASFKLIKNHTSHGFLFIGFLLTVFPLIVNAQELNRLTSWLPDNDSDLSGILATLILLPLLILYGFSFFVGTAICFWCAGRSMLRLHKPVIAPALVVPLLCNGYIFVQALPFLMVPSGTGIRPMGWALLTLVLAIVATAFALIYAIPQFRTSQGKVICSIGALLSLFPIPIATSSLRLMAAIKGFQLEP